MLCAKPVYNKCFNSWQLAFTRLFGSQLFCRCRKVSSCLNNIGKIKYAMNRPIVFRDWILGYFLCQAAATAEATLKCISLSKILGTKLSGLV